MELALQEQKGAKHKAYLMKKCMEYQKWFKARTAHVVEVSNAENKGETKIKSQINAQSFRKANTAERREQH